MQSGHISAVGFDLYTQLVAEAVGRLEGHEAAAEEVKEVRIELPVDAHLPERYVGDQEQRLEAYRRLALATSQETVDDVLAEWEDRYGPPPDAARSLIDIARLRVEALRVGINEVMKLKGEIRLAPVNLSTSQEVRLQRLAPKAVLRGAEGVLFLPAPGEPVAGLLNFLAKMWPA